jgi:hypothetical protein
MAIPPVFWCGRSEIRDGILDVRHIFFQLFSQPGGRRPFAAHNLLIGFRIVTFDLNDALVEL